MTNLSEQVVPATVSNLIPHQFPAWFQENGPQFVAFVKAYFQWLESPNNPLYYTRQYYSIKDIDFTLDQFIIHFKQKYLHNLQLQTQSDTRLLIKHALDIYRSKGTERCVELLFQLVFAESVRFYYPSQDLMKLSDGQWYIPEYLELTLADTNIQLVNQEIVGLRSGAKAFVENVIRKMVQGRLVDIAFLSAVNGTFITGEKVGPA